MIVRVRSRDGLERVTAPDEPCGATVGQLRAQIEAQLGVSASAKSLSCDQNLLLAKTPAQSAAFSDLSDPSAPLSSPVPPATHLRRSRPEELCPSRLPSLLPAATYSPGCGTTPAIRKGLSSSTNPYRRLRSAGFLLLRTSDFLHPSMRVRAAAPDAAVPLPPPVSFARRHRRQPFLGSFWLLNPLAQPPPPSLLPAAILGFLRRNTPAIPSSSTLPPTAPLLPPHPLANGFTRPPDSQLSERLAAIWTASSSGLSPAHTSSHRDIRTKVFLFLRFFFTVIDQLGLFSTPDPFFIFIF